MSMIPDPPVTVAPAVLAPPDLEQRIGELRAEISRRLGDPATMSETTASLARRARRLHEMWWTVAPPDNPAGGGVRGRASYEVRRVTHRLVRWYVEPRLVAQREIDAELARFATDAAAALHQLQTDVERLGGIVDRLQRDVAATRSHQVECRRS